MNIYSCEYEANGLWYAIHIQGTWKEVQQHAENLGLENPELVNALVPFNNEGMH